MISAEEITKAATVLDRLGWMNDETCYYLARQMTDAGAAELAAAFHAIGNQMRDTITEAHGGA